MRLCLRSWKVLSPWESRRLCCRCSYAWDISQDDVWIVSNCRGWQVFVLRGFLVESCRSQIRCLLLQVQPIEAAGSLTCWHPDSDMQMGGVSGKNVTCGFRAASCMPKLHALSELSAQSRDPCCKRFTQPGRPTADLNLREITPRDLDPAWVQLFSTSHRLPNRPQAPRTSRRQPEPGNVWKPA